MLPRLKKKPVATVSLAKSPTCGYGMKLAHDLTVDSVKNNEDGSLGPAGAAGIVSGCRITSVNGVAVSSKADIAAQLKANPAATSAEFQFDLIDHITAPSRPKVVPPPRARARTPSMAQITQEHVPAAGAAAAVSEDDAVQLAAAMRTEELAKKEKMEKLKAKMTAMRVAAEETEAQVHALSLSAQGFIMKRGGSGGGFGVQNWKRRWATIDERGDFVYYTRDQSQPDVAAEHDKARGMLDLTQYLAFEGETEFEKYSVELKGPVEFCFYTSSIQERHAWMAAFKELCHGGLQRSMSSVRRLIKPDLEPESDDDDAPGASAEDAVSALSSEAMLSDAESLVTIDPDITLELVQGWIEKRGGSASGGRKNWKKRWARINEKGVLVPKAGGPPRIVAAMEYFEMDQGPGGAILSGKDVVPKGTLELATFAAVVGMTKPFEFNVVLKSPEDAEHQFREFCFFTTTSDERNAWMSAFAKLCRETTEADQTARNRTATADVLHDAVAGAGKVGHGVASLLHHTASAVKHAVEHVETQDEEAERHRAEARSLLEASESGKQLVPDLTDNLAVAAAEKAAVEAAAAAEQAAADAAATAEKAAADEAATAEKAAAQKAAAEAELLRQEEEEAAVAVKAAADKLAAEEAAAAKAAKDADLPLDLPAADLPPPSGADFTPDVPALPTLTAVRALYDYANADDPEDLAFTEGQTFALIAVGSDGWSTGFLNGKQGTFPSSYVEEFTPEPDEAPTAPPADVAVADLPLPPPVAVDGSIGSAFRPEDDEHAQAEKMVKMKAKMTAIRDAAEEADAQGEDPVSPTSSKQRRELAAPKMVVDSSVGAQATWALLGKMGGADVTDSNERSSTSIVVNELKDLERRFVGNVQLDCDDRKLVRTGSLHKLSRNRIEAMLFILTSDCLIYARKLPGELLLFHRRLDLTSFEVRDVPEDKADVPFSFQILTPEKSFTVAAESLSDKSAWLEDICGVLVRVSTQKLDLATVYVSASTVAQCQLCELPFTFKRHRHHCRACGRVCCNACTLRKIDGERVCDDDYPRLVSLLPVEDEAPAKDEGEHGGGAETVSYMAQIFGRGKTRSTNPDGLKTKIDQFLKPGEKEACGDEEDAAPKVDPEDVAAGVAQQKALDLYAEVGVSGLQCDFVGQSQEKTAAQMVKTISRSTLVFKIHLSLTGDDGDLHLWCLSKNFLEFQELASTLHKKFDHRGADAVPILEKPRNDNQKRSALQNFIKELLERDYLSKNKEVCDFIFAKEAFRREDHVTGGKAAEGDHDAALFTDDDSDVEIDLFKKKAPPMRPKVMLNKVGARMTDGMFWEELLKVDSKAKESFHADAKHAQQHLHSLAAAEETRISLIRLVGLLTREGSDRDLPNIFIWSHTQFTNSSVLLAMLKARYNVPLQNDKVQADLEARGENPNTYAYAVQVQVMRFVKLWVEESYSDFSSDAALLDALRSFNTMVATTHREASTEITALLAREEVTRGVRNSQLQTKRPPPGKPGGPPMPSVRPSASPAFANLSYLAPPAQEIARQLTLMDYDSFNSIPKEEFFAWTAHKRHELSPHILQFIARHHAVEATVIGSIVQTVDLAERKEVISKWITITRFLNELRSYNMLAAVLQGLSSSVVKRLSRTFGEMDGAFTDLLARLAELFAKPAAYLAVVAKAKPPCIPSLREHLAELLLIARDNPSAADSEVVNFRRRRIEYQQVSMLMGMQGVTYNLLAVRKMQEPLQGAHARNSETSVQEQLHQSKACEPGGSHL